MREKCEAGDTEMTLAKRLVGLGVFLVGFSGAVRAQDKRPDQAAIVDSFKQKIQDVLKAENSRRGPEHAEFASRSVETPPILAAPVIVPIQGRGLMAGYVLKDGSPCKTWHTGRCYQGFADNSGALYVNSKGVPCNPEKNPDTCSANGVTAAAKLAAAKAAPKPIVNVLWRKRYTATVSEFGFDVRVTDSLVTPYTGVFSYSEVIWLTAEHPTKGDAEQDSSFTASSQSSHTLTYGYQDGKWIFLK
jgi:hypothetical protein